MKLQFLPAGRVGCLYFWFTLGKEPGRRFLPPRSNPEILLNPQVMGGEPLVAGYAGTCGSKGNRAAPSCRFALRTSCPPARGASRLLPCRLCGAGWGKGPDGGTPATPGGGRALIVASPDHPTVCVGESWRGPAVPSPIPLGVLRHGVAPLLRVSMAFVLFRSGWGFRWGGRDPVRASPMPTGSQRGGSPS